MLFKGSGDACVDVASATTQVVGSDLQCSPCILSHYAQSHLLSTVSHKSLLISHCCSFGHADAVISNTGCAGRYYSTFTSTYSDDL